MEGGALLASHSMTMSHKQELNERRLVLNAACKNKNICQEQRQRQRLWQQLAGVKAATAAAAAK